MKHLIGCALVCASMLACGKADFGGKGGKAIQPPKAKSDSNAGVLEGILASPCTPGDADAVLEAKNVQIPKLAKTCMDDGFMYNFGNGACTKLAASKSLSECSEAGIRSFADEIGVDLNEHLKKLSDADARFITCAEDEGKRAVVLQWIIPSQGKVEHDTSKCVLAEEKNVYHLCIPKGAGDDCPSDISEAFSQ